MISDLNELAQEHLAAARDNEHGRSSHLYLHDGQLRQTLIALTKGARLGEHNAPTAASLYVVIGRILLAPRAATRSWRPGSPTPARRNATRSRPWRTRPSY